MLNQPNCFIVFLGKLLSEIALKQGQMLLIRFSTDTWTQLLVFQLFFSDERLKVHSLKTSNILHVQILTVVTRMLQIVFVLFVSNGST